MKGPVDHAYAQEHDLYEAYLAGRLSEEDREAFEAHYFDCEECLRQLELAEDFRAGARDLAVAALGGTPVREMGAATPFPNPAAPLGFLAALALLSHRRRIALSGALLLLLALPTALLWKGVGAPSGRVAGEREPAPSRTAELESRLRDLEGKAGEERRALAAELARERQARAEAERKAGATRPAPEINVAVFTLAAVRGEEEGREPVNRLRLPAGTGSFVVAVELAAVDHPSYGARLSDGSGREIWKARGLRPDGRDTLTVLLPASLVPPGRYALHLEGERAGGGNAPAGDYPFQVERSR